MNVIGYVRVSTDGQIDAYGLDAQQAAITAWARATKHRVVEVIEDLGVSGTTDAIDRPGLSMALARLREGSAAGLVVARLDRLARALTVQEATLAVIWRMGGEVFTCDAGRVLADDPDDPMRTALRQVVGVFAELDRRMVVKRLRDGRTAKQAAGRKAVGAYPYGYAGSGKGRQRDAKPINEEQAAIRAAIALRSKGLSYRRIACELTAAGHRPRRAMSWSAMSVRSIVLKHQGASANGGIHADSPG